MKIKNTNTETKYPWPEDCRIQGGEHGIVFFSDDGSNYNTAFVETFSGTFLRGEGKTISEAEDDCWTQYQKMISCLHDVGFDPRKYTNGAGFCNKCGTWFSHVLKSIEEDSNKTTSFFERVLQGDEDATKIALEAIKTVISP